MKSLAILGASGHGRVIADAASLTHEWDSISFFDDLCHSDINCFPWAVIGSTQDLMKNISQFSGVVVGIGDNVIRQKKYELLVKYNASMATIVHPQAAVSPYAILGLGSVIFAQAAINSNAKVGLGTIINTAATVDHDCKLSDYVHLSPGSHLGGNVTIGKRSWIGIGSVVRHSLHIGSDVIVGAGSAVVKPVFDNQTVVGIPAKSL